MICRFEETEPGLQGRAVCNLPPGTCLCMMTYHSGGGSVMPGHQFYNGDEIWIHSKYWEGGCFLAYDKGEFGYVDAQYVR